MKIAYGLLAATALIAFIPAAYAENADGSDIIVTAGRMEQDVGEVSQSVTVIDNTTIQKRQTVSVMDLLRTVPGVTVSRTGGIGAVGSVFIRGANSEQTVALIDGVKLNDPSQTGGGFNFGNLLASNISRIEVVRGSQSVLWGSQAIGGVINMITAEPEEQLHANLRGEYGSRDTANLVGNVSAKVGPVAASIGGGYYRTDGISSFSEARGGTERDGYRNYNANAKFKVTLTDAISVDLRGWYVDGKAGIDGYAPPAYIFGDTREFSRTKEFVGYTGLNVALFDGKLHNRFGFALTDTRRLTTDESGATPSPEYAYRGRNERFEYQGIANITKGVEATFGAETEKASYRGSSYGSPFSDPVSVRTDSYYGQLNVQPIAGLNLNGGVRHDHHDDFGGHTSLSAGGTYSPNGGVTRLRASYGEGFKAPSLYQLHGDYGNSALKPETSTGWEVGLNQQFFGGKLSADVAYFERVSRNLINWVSLPVSPWGTYENVDQAKTRGTELTVTLTPVERLSIQSNFTWAHSYDRTTSLDLLRRPRYHASASVDYEWPFGLSTGMTMTHVGTSEDFDWDTYSRVKLAGYELFDIRTSYPVTKQVELFARIENLFNDHYETAYQYGTMGRAGYVGLRLKY